jgi:hypothetical protein
MLDPRFVFKASSSYSILFIVLLVFWDILSLPKQTTAAAAASTGQY